MDLAKLSELDPEEIQDTLEALCVDRETMTFLRPMLPEELLKAKDDLAQTAIEQKATDTAFEKEKELYKLRKKPLDKKFATTLDSIRSKAIEVEDDLYMIPDQDRGKMNYISREGYTVNSRDLLPEEKKMISLGSRVDLKKVM